MNASQRTLSGEHLLAVCNIRELMNETVIVSGFISNAFRRSI